jgi:hypothetical protein
MSRCDLLMVAERGIEFAPKETLNALVGDFAARRTITLSRVPAAAAMDCCAFFLVSATPRAGKQIGASKREHQSSCRFAAAAFPWISCDDAASDVGEAELVYLPHTSRISNDHFVTLRSG